MNQNNPFECLVDARKDTDWTLCCLCQEQNKKDLRCPYVKECYHNAYQTLEYDLNQFVQNHVPLPLGVTLECLDDGSGIANTLLKNEAKYHNGCRAHFRSHILERALDKRARDESDSVEATFSPKKTRSSFNASLDPTRLQCVCCELCQDESDEQIFTARTEQCGKNLYKWAMESKNWVVHARLITAVNEKGIVAGDVYYHASCYTKLKNAARAATSRSTEASSSAVCTYDPLVMAQLVAFMQFKQTIFKLAYLRKLYDRRLEQLQSDWIGVYVHQKRFKEHLLMKLGPDWSEYSEGRDIYISHKKTVGAALAHTADLEVTEDGATKIIEVGLMLRRHILLQQMPFNGSFNSCSLSEPVAKPLLALLDALLQGSASIEENGDDEQDETNARLRVACTISQLICSNAVKKASNAVTLYQKKERETPFPLYVGLKLHANDRQKSTISTFHSLGMSVSYDRVMEVRKKLALAVSVRFAEDGVVVPSNMKRGVFTTGGVDNIDESGRIELHGTAISLTNHLTHGNMGVDPPPLTFDFPEGAAIHLPDYYAIVPYIDEHAGEIALSSIPNGTARPALIENVKVTEHEDTWLRHINQVFIKDDGHIQEIPVTYSGFLSHNQSVEDIRPRATVGVFPIFYEKASTMAMQKHAMLVVKKAIAFLNPGQIPVIEGDCPLYTQQKKCQWMYPNEVGESKMVCLIGFLHVEMTLQDCGGKLLAGSGWERMFSMAKIFTTGVASSLLAGKHIKRTRYAYHLTLAWLHVLELQAYNAYCHDGYGPHEPIEMWEKRLISNAPTICYWMIVREYLLLNCRFVRGQRVGDWPLTLSACDEMCRWFFAFGHTNYARWMPVFLKDMAQLPESHPSVHQAFMEGKFVVQRGDKKASLMALDQSQEHSIKFLKDDSGAKGLYGQQEEKEVIELSKPEVLRAIHEFETACFSESNMDRDILEHPESSTAEQNMFLTQLKALCDLTLDGTVVNPFMETSPELITLDTGEVMDPAITDSLKKAPGLGNAMYTEFVSERIEKAVKPLSDVIPRANVFTFSNRPHADIKKGSDKLGSAKSNAALIAKLFISLQARPDADLDDFFRHENQREPPSLSDQGRLRFGTKSDILGCLPGMPVAGHSVATKEATVVILDMAAVIHIIKPQRASTFGEYTEMQLLPYLRSQMTDNTTRIDAIWDTYRDASLKSQTRAKRGETIGSRTRVSAKVPIPKGVEWQKFLKDCENKDQFFKFISQELQRCTADLPFQLLTTKGDLVLSNMPSDLQSLSPCQQEEADTRMMLHLRHAADQGHSKAYLRTVDSDVVVLAINFFQQINLTELWIGFGTGKTYKDIPVHVISQKIGPQRCKALPFFHAYTGCDVASAMSGIGKKTAWNAWDSFPDVTETIVEMTEDPTSLTQESVHMRHLQRWTVLMYSKTCGTGLVNEARKIMFTHGLKSLDSIPPTEHALFQHAKRALFTAAFVWKQSLCKAPTIPSPSGWGWEWNARTKAWVPYWTELADVSHACSLLLHCGCTVACKGNCKCHRAGLRCSTLCKCEGGCTNNNDNGN